MTSLSDSLLVAFCLDDQRYGLRLGAVNRCIRAVEVTPLPKAPEAVLGVINVGGEIVPVFNIRKRFGLRDGEIDPRDQIIVACTQNRKVALWVDSVTDVTGFSPEEFVAADEILPSIEYVEGVVKLKDGMIFIHDLSRFLSLEEDQALEKALHGS